MSRRGRMGFVDTSSLTVISIGELERGGPHSLTLSDSMKSITMTYVSQIGELTKEVVKLIEASEGRSRSRTVDEQLRFKHAVHVLLTDLWKAVKSTPKRECSINKRSGWYSENPRYRDPLLTYSLMIVTATPYQNSCRQSV